MFDDIAPLMLVYMAGGAITALVLIARNVILVYKKVEKIADDLHVIANHYRRLQEVPTALTPEEVE